MIFIGTWDIHNRPQEYIFNPSDTYFYVLDATPASDNNDEGITDPAGSGYDLIWKAELGDLIWSSPAIDEETNTVYIGCTDKHLYAFDSTTGAPKWNFTAGGPVYNTPAVYNDKIFFGTTEPVNSMYSLDKVTGKLIWKFEAGEKVAASPVAADGRIYQPVMNNRILALDPGGSGDGTTSIIWSVELPNRLRATPAISDGHLFISCWDGKLYSIGTLPKERLVVSGINVRGDSEKAGIEFALINLGEGQIRNGTLYVYEDKVLLFEEEMGQFVQNANHWITHDLKDPKEGKRNLRIKLIYFDYFDNQKIFYYNQTVEIEKPIIPSFIPAPGTAVTIIGYIAAAMIRNKIVKRKKITNAITKMK